jgi:hypothetical protein
LYPLPLHATGGRLCKILGLEIAEYLDTFDRVNLIKIMTSRTSRWPAADAKLSVLKLIHRRRILLGAKVCAAHGVAFKPFQEFTIYDISKDGRPHVRVLVLPHPSGRCRIWNDGGAARSARRAVQRFLEEARRDEEVVPS